MDVIFTAGIQARGAWGYVVLRCITNALAVCTHQVAITIRCGRTRRVDLGFCKPQATRWCQYHVTSHP
jgi:hypothetical protein